MLPAAIRPDVYWVGVNDFQPDLFEGLWYIRDIGISYNAYLIQDEKNVLIDTVGMKDFDLFFRQIQRVLNPAKLDYVVVNHMEPDHSGSLRLLREAAPQVTILGSKKTAGMLDAFYGIKEGVQIVEDGEELALGKHTLKFFATPRLHWPETIMTYLMDEKVLFSCDAFGGYGALAGYLFDDECPNLENRKQQTLRYYANILTSFAKPIHQALDKLAGLPLGMIAPSHGVIWRRDPQRVIDWYKEWASYADAPAEKAVTLVYGSMYGNTAELMEAVAQGIASECLPLEIFDVGRTPFSLILPSIYIKRGVVVGAPTYERSLFPPMAALLELCDLKEIHHKKAAFISSHSWGGGAVKQAVSLFEVLGWEMALEPLDITSGPTARELEAARDFGIKFARMIKEE